MSNAATRHSERPLDWTGVFCPVKPAPAKALITLSAFASTEKSPSCIIPPFDALATEVAAECEEAWDAITDSSGVDCCDAARVEKGYE